MKLSHSLPDEQVVTVIRKHWLVFLFSISRSLLLLILPIPLSYFLLQFFPGISEGTITFALATVFGSIYYLLIWLFSFIRFVDLYLDVWVVTDKRIINIEQKGMFSRIESEYMHYKIQDITTEVHGVFATLFNYGEIHVQTAAESQRFVFTHAPDPYGLKRRLAELVENSKKKDSL